MEKILELLAAINFWTIVAGVASVLAIALTLLIWRKQTKRELQSPILSDLHKLEELVSSVFSNAEILHNLPSDRKSTNKDNVEAINKASWEIRDICRSIRDRHSTTDAAVENCDAFYKEFSSQINSKIMNYERVRDQLRNLRSAVT